MRIVVFEDNNEKWMTIRSALIEKGIRDSGIKRIESVAQFVQIASVEVDLCIIDLMMPGVTGGDARRAGGELLQMLEYSGLQGIPILAITAYMQEANDQRHAFSARGCIIYDYDDKHIWSQALDIFIAQAREKGRYDFLILTALQSERDAYLKLFRTSVKSLQRGGLNLLECDHAGKAGAILLMPRMGLVNASIVTARALERYHPSVVAMSGICAGVNDNSQLGQLLVADLAWEYQSGKWLDELFEAEPYQVTIPDDTRLTLSKILEDKSLLNELEQDYEGSVRPSQRTQPKLAPFATGSAVIASDKRLSALEKQHRKVAGVDMEIFGFYRAIELSGRHPHAFSAKTVVDKGNNQKDDKLHEYGCVISAKFVLKALSCLFNPDSNQD